MKGETYNGDSDSEEEKTELRLAYSISTVN